MLYVYVMVIYVYVYIRVMFYVYGFDKHRKLLMGVRSSKHSTELQ